MKLLFYTRFLSDRFELITNKKGEENSDDDTASDVIDGQLIDRTDKSKVYFIRKGMPLFLDNSTDNYSDNFGLQWNKFKRTQFDSYSGLTITEDRFWKTTKWSKHELKDKVILEAGSGAGRFTEVLGKTGATVISFDLSNAVNANEENNRDKNNIFLFQGDIYKVPFPDNYFDFVFCHGVLQHTPDPNEAYKCLFRKLKPGGKISIDYYTKSKFSPWSTPKYFWRPVTKKMSPRKLLSIIKIYMPLWLPFDTLIRKIPRIGERILAIIRIPCWNYIGYGFTYKQRLQWAILDTFDALAPAYDFPKSKREIEIMIESPQNALEEVFFGGNGIVANIQKR